VGQAGGLGDQREANGGQEGGLAVVREGAGYGAVERGITSRLRHRSKVKVKSVLNRHYSTTVKITADEVNTNRETVRLILTC
jgi:hypothetical protein